MKKYSSKVNAFLLHFMTLWLALGLALVLPVRARSTLHWIELENGKRVWMSEQEVFDFAVSRSGKNADLTFRDVTDEYLDRTEQKKMKVPNIDFIHLNPSQTSRVNDLNKSLQAKDLLEVDRNVEALGLRYYESQKGADAATWLHDRFITLAMGRTDIEVLYFNHSFKQPSVIARIKGNGPHASERVIIGAHEDSIVGAGADDDGSGVATVLEAFRVIAASDYKPDRTIEFILYAAEEPGLIGSHYVAASYASKEIPVAGVLQLDMTLYPDSAHKFFMFTGSSCPSPAITQFLLKLAKTYSAMGVTTSAENNYSTDHASWCSVGTPATRVREGKDLNPYMHSTEDTSDRVDPVFGLEFVKLSIAFAVEVAEAPIQK